LPTPDTKKKRVAKGRLSGPVQPIQIRITKETMMRNEIKIVEDGVIFELEIEEVEEVVAPAVLVVG
jgi:hypothetical protein